MAIGVMKHICHLPDERMSDSSKTGENPICCFSHLDVAKCDFFSWLFLGDSSRKDVFVAKSKNQEVSERESWWNGFW